VVAVTGRRGAAVYQPIMPVLLRAAVPAKCPFLETSTASVSGEAHDPQVAVLLAERLAIADLHPNHRGVAVDRDDVAGPRERLIGPVALCLPHAGDRGQPGHRVLVWPRRYVASAVKILASASIPGALQARS
jgi:hypothetical protein